MDAMTNICAAFSEELESSPRGCPCSGRLSCSKTSQPHLDTSITVLGPVLWYFEVLQKYRRNHVQDENYWKVNQHLIQNTEAETPTWLSSENEVLCFLKSMEVVKTSCEWHWRCQRNTWLTLPILGLIQHMMGSCNTPFIRVKLEAQTLSSLFFFPLRVVISSWILRYFFPTWKKMLFNYILIWLHASLKMNLVIYVIYNYTDWKLGLKYHREETPHWWFGFGFFFSWICLNLRMFSSEMKK